MAEEHHALVYFSVRKMVDIRASIRWGTFCKKRNLDRSVAYWWNNRDRTFCTFDGETVRCFVLWPLLTMVSISKVCSPNEGNTEEAEVAAPVVARRQRMKS